MHIVLTRPRQQSLVFADVLKARFGDDLSVVIAPLVEIVELPVEVDFAIFKALVFTSQNGVRAYQRLGGPEGARAYCVGDRTAEVARDAGLEAISAGGDLAALNALLERDAAGQRLLHLSGHRVAGEVTGNVTRIAAYDQHPVATPDHQLEDALAQPHPVVVPLFSPFVAEQFQRMVPTPCKAPLSALCISQAVAAKLDPQRFVGIGVCDVPTADAMIREIGKVIRSQGA